MTFYAHCLGAELIECWSAEDKYGIGWRFNFELPKQA